MLAVARRCAERDGLSIRWRSGDAGALPFDQSTFDAVLCQQGLQFFPDRIRALREMSRVTVPGGMIALSVFAAADPYRVALAEGLAACIGPKSAAGSLAPYSLGDRSLLHRIAIEAGLGEIAIRIMEHTRRVEPTQEWLLQDTEGMPFGDDIAAMDAVARAAMIRGIAAKLRRFWKSDAISCRRRSISSMRGNRQRGRLDGLSIGPDTGFFQPL
jgi:SAM-dependent methyltransferase